MIHFFPFHLWPLNKYLWLSFTCVCMITPVLTYLALSICSKVSTFNQILIIVKYKCNGQGVNQSSCQQTQYQNDISIKAFNVKGYITWFTSCIQQTTKTPIPESSKTFRHGIRSQCETLTHTRASNTSSHKALPITPINSNNQVQQKSSFKFTHKQRGIVKTREDTYGN